MHTLVDSGACRSMIREDVWKQCCKETGSPDTLHPGVTLRSLSGHTLPTVGVCKIQLLGEWLELYVVTEMRHDMLLGIDALNTLEMMLDCKSKTVELGSSIFHWGTFEQIAEITGTQSEIDEWRKEFPNLFNIDKKQWKTVDNIEMYIETGDAPPTRQRPYRIPLHKREIVEKEIEQMLADNIIRPSISPYRHLNGERS